MQDPVIDIDEEEAENKKFFKNDLLNDTNINNNNNNNNKNKNSNSNNLEDDDLNSREVQIYIQFLRIGEIDTINEKYYAEVRIESKWAEKSNIIKYDPDTCWNPKLYVENTMLDPKESIKYEITNCCEMSIIKEIRQLKGYFWERLELELFPFDIQELSIVVTSELKTSELKLVPDPVRSSSIDYKASRIFVDQQKWNLYKFVHVTQLASYDLPSSFDTKADISYARYHSKFVKIQPKFVAKCFCARRPGYYFFNAYFIIFLITILALTVFSIDCKLPQNRLQNTFTLVLTSASFKWVINRSLPTISYMTSLDKYSIICIFYLCIVCVWHSIAGAFWSPGYAAHVDFWMFVVFILVFIFIHLAFFLWFLKAFKSVKNLEKLNEKFVEELKHQECFRV